jgi:ABC-type glutathione transport system ATPase component
MSHLIESNDLVTTFPYDGKKRLTAVMAFRFNLNKGEIIGLVGVTGSGKSVTVL